MSEYLVLGVFTALMVLLLVGAAAWVIRLERARDAREDAAHEARMRRLRHGAAQSLNRRPSPRRKPNE